MLDHSLPIGSGYSYRSRSIVLFQQRLGLQPLVLTSPKQGTATDGRDVIEGIPHYRTGRAGGPLPFLRAREFHLQTRPYALWFDLRSSLPEQLQELGDRPCANLPAPGGPFSPLCGCGGEGML